MEFWLDTIDRQSIEQAKECGVLQGITTNPSILAKAHTSAEEVIEGLLNSFSGPIAVQVVLPLASEMIEQGRDLYDFSPRIIVKVPVTPEGIQTISRLSHAEIPTMATAVVNPCQALLASKAGAHYVAVFFAHIGDRALEVVSSIQQVLNGSSTKLLVAALRKPEQVEQCAQRGFAAVTISPDLFQQCLATPKQTMEQLKRFEADWKTAPTSNLLTTQQLIS